MSNLFTHSAYCLVGQGPGVKLCILTLSFSLQSIMIFLCSFQPGSSSQPCHFVSTPFFGLIFFPFCCSPVLSPQPANLFHFFLFNPIITFQPSSEVQHCPSSLGSTGSTGSISSTGPTGSTELTKFIYPTAVAMSIFCCKKNTYNLLETKNPFSPEPVTKFWQSFFHINIPKASESHAYVAYNYTCYLYT